MADLGKYINLKDKTSAGRNIYNLQLPDQKMVSSTNLNKLRRSRAEFLKNNPEYKGKKTYIPEFQKPLAALKTELADKKKIKIEELVELVEKHFKGRYTPDPSPNLALSDRPVYHYLKDLQNKHPSVFKGTKVISEWSEGQDFKKWLLNKVKRAKNPIVTGVTELVEKSGFNVSPAAAAPLIRRNPILNKMITIKEPRIGKGKYDTYHSGSKKFRDWYAQTYDTPWEDLKETKGEKASTYKYNAYTKYQADLKAKPPTNFIRTDVLSKKINETMPIIHQYGRGHDKTAPGQMFKKLFGTTEIKRGKGYLKDPSDTAIKKWKEFQKGDHIPDDLAKDVKKLHNKYGDIIKSKGFDLYKDAPIEKVMDKLGTISPSRAASAMASLGRLYEGETFRTFEFEDISPSAKSGERLIAQLGSSSGGRTKYKNAFYNLALKELNKFYKGQGGGSFYTFRDNFLERLQKIIPDHTFNINEVIPITMGKVRDAAPWSAFIDVTQAKINQGALGRYGGELSTKTRQVEQALADPTLGTAKAEQLAKTLRTTTLGATKKTLAGPKYGLSSEQIKQLNFPEIVVGEEIDRKIYNQAQLDRWKDKGLDIEKFAKERGYYFDVKKGTPFWEARQSLDSLEDIFANNKGNACVIFPRKAAAPGGPITGGCVDQFRKAMQDDPNGTLKMISEMPAKGGPWSRIKTSASNMINKLPKGGRLGMALTAIGAVGAGTWAMMGGAEAEEAPTTDQMTYNAITGTFDNAEGDPETQEGILNWIGEHPIYSGLAAVPVGMGAGLGADAMKAENVAKFFKSMKFMLPPAYAAEKIYQYKQGEDLGEMFTNPLDAVWAMALDTPKSAAGKMDYYRNIAQKRVGIGPLAKGAVEAEQLGLRHLKGKGTWEAVKRATMAPRSAGTRLVFPFAGPKAGAGWGMKIFRGAARLAPLGPLPMALLAGSMAWDKYKFNKKIGDHVDALRSRGVVNEEDAQTMSTIYKQGWLGTTAIGAKLLGSEELMFEGEMLDIDAQKRILAGMKDYYEGREDVAMQERAGERQEDFFTWFSKGGRVGLADGGDKKPFGSMTRRSFLKWLVGSIAAGVAAISGKGLKQLTKTATSTVAKTPAKFIGVEGMPAWFPRVVAQIKTHGKLIEMADKHYVTGDKYEMMIPIKVPKMKGHPEGGFEEEGFETVMRKVTMEDNPLNGEIELSWSVSDFDGDMIRQINFKPGQAGYQKFGVDDADAAAQGITEYRRVKVEEPEFTYGNPSQTDPHRKDFEFQDIFEEGDEVVKGLEDMTKTKQMLAKDGSVIEVFAEGKLVDKEFQKKIFKDIEGEGQIIPEPEGVGVSDKGDIYGEEQFKEIIEGVVPEHLKKKAEGGRVGMKFGGSWADWKSNHEDQMTFEEYLKMDFDKPVHPIDKNAGGIIETGNIARRPGAVPPLSGPTPQGSGIVGLFSSPKRVNVT